MGKAFVAVCGLVLGGCAPAVDVEPLDKAVGSLVLWPLSGPLSVEEARASRAFPVNAEVRVLAYRERVAELTLGVELGPEVGPTDWPAVQLPEPLQVLHYVPGAGWRSEDQSAPFLRAFEVRCASLGGCPDAVSGSCTIPCASHGPAPPVPPEALEAPSSLPCRAGWTLEIVQGWPHCAPPVDPAWAHCSGASYPDAHGACAPIGSLCGDYARYLPPSGPQTILQPTGIGPLPSTLPDDAVIILAPGVYSTGFTLHGTQTLVGSCASGTRVQGLGAAPGSSVHFANLSATGMEVSNNSRFNAEAVVIEPGRVRIPSGAALSMISSVIRPGPSFELDVLSGAVFTLDGGAIEALAGAPPQAVRVRISGDARLGEVLLREAPLEVAGDGRLEADDLVALSSTLSFSLHAFGALRGLRQDGAGLVTTGSSTVTVLGGHFTGAQIRGAKLRLAFSEIEGDATLEGGRLDGSRLRGTLTLKHLELPPADPLPAFARDSWVDRLHTLQEAEVDGVRMGSALLEGPSSLGQVWIEQDAEINVPGGMGVVTVARGQVDGAVLIRSGDAISLSDVRLGSAAASSDEAVGNVELQRCEVALGLTVLLHRLDLVDVRLGVAKAARSELSAADLAMTRVVAPSLVLRGPALLMAALGQNLDLRGPADAEAVLRVEGSVALSLGQFHLANPPLDVSHLASDGGLNFADGIVDGPLKVSPRINLKSVSAGVSFPSGPPFFVLQR
ncbi:MAG: hypothetical protein U1E65_13625 [Myxococcota bacterium]